MTGKSGRTLAVRPLEKGDPVSPPLVQTSMYHLPGAPDGYPYYGRNDNPTWEVTEAALTQLEQAPALLFPSGMGAISAALMATLSAGDRLVLPSDGYYATRLLADGFLSRFGIVIETRPTAAFLQGGFSDAKVVFLETPSNPGLELMDIGAVSDAAKATGATVIVDNTTMTALGQRPLDLGADVIVASDTKAPGGHSDLLLGHVASRDTSLMARIREWRSFSGAIPGPMEAWLLHRGLQTLDMRFDRMCGSAEIIAERFRTCGISVNYPGLPDHPDHALAREQMTRFGFLMTLTFETADRAERFINSCPLLQPATSFGGVHSSAERRARWGDAVPEGFVRLSVGCEPVEDLWSALSDAIDS